MKIRAIIFLVPLALLALALAGGSALVMRLFFLSILVPAISYLWTVLGIRGISVQSAPPPEHCQVGERFQQEITVTNNGRLPKLWLRVEEASDMPGRHDAAVLSLMPGDSHRWQSTVLCRRRGLYHLGSVVATSSDPFGLFSRRRVTGEPQTMLVYPATLDLPLFKASSFNEFGYGAGYQSISQISANASSVREFASGDSLNHIHWASTAHTGRLMVKMFDADRSANSSKTVWLVLDMQAGGHVGEGEESTEEYGVTIAASLAKKHIDTGMRVGLMTQGEPGYMISPDRGEEHLWRLLEALAVAKAAGQTPVSQLISDNLERLRGDCIVIIISPSVTGELYDATRQLRNRVDSLVAVLLDPASFGGASSMTTAARNLSATGVQAYVVQQGDELARALDHRVSPLHVGYV